MQVLRIAYFSLASEGRFDLRVLKEELMLPFSEVVRQLVVGLFRHNVFFNLVIAFYLFED
jgi:hypothetical protein